MQLRVALTLLSFIIALVCAAQQAREEVFFFPQRIDHFNSLNRDVFYQRYFFFQPAGVDKNSPNHLIYICPEATCSGTPDNYVKQYAKDLDATIYTLEHRFYGWSVPYETVTTEVMAKYLTTESALADLAVFIESLSHLPSANGKPHQFIIVGCSYPGALSAWFSEKYPHLVKGALSSSGVVNAIENFYTFDLHVQHAAGKNCSDNLIRVNRIMEKMDPKDLLRDFQAPSDMDIRDLFLLFSDIGAESIQYGYHSELCDSLSKGNIDNDQVLYSNFLTYSLSFFYKVYETTPLDYYNKAIANTTYDKNLGANSDRSWWFQTCSELAYFQTSPPSPMPSIRPKFLNLSYFLEKCNKIFGYNIVPNVGFVNTQYGATRVLNATAGRTIFANGSQDPWLKAGVDIDPKKFSFLIECENCGHCVDLRGCPSLPSAGPSNKCTAEGTEQVKKVREQTLAIMKMWFGQ